MLLYNKNKYLILCLARPVSPQTIRQQPDLSGGPTTSSDCAANFLLPTLGLTDLLEVTWWWRLAGTGAGAGFMLTPLAWLLPELLLLPLSDWPEPELAVGEEAPPDTRLWDLVLFRSARVPGGEWKLLVELLLTRAGLMVTDTWMLIGSCEAEFCLFSREEPGLSSTDCLRS